MALTEEQRKRMEENRIRALQIKRTREFEREQRERNNRLLATEGNTSNIFQDGGFVLTQQNMETMGGDRSTRGNDSSDHSMKRSMKRSINGGEAAIPTRDTCNTIWKDTVNDDDEDDDESSLEEFEHSASPYITQTEAQRSYCLPMGTLAVCSYIEKDNPHKRGWSKMKLYDRKEVRRRARQRFGGKAGLIQERESRKRKRLEKDLEEMKDVFSSR